MNTAQGSTPADEDAWRVLDVEQSDPETLFAKGLSLLDALADEPTPTLRWYRSTQPALVLGRGQGRLDVHPDDGLAVISRHSGGGAVLLDPSSVNLDVLIPDGHRWLAGDDLGTVFTSIGNAWAEGLRHLGIAEVEVYSGPATARRRGSPWEQLLAAVCYATLGRGEVLVGGRKLVGLSQRRRRTGALVQCGLLRRWEPAPLLRALGADLEDRNIMTAAVGLDELVPERIPDDVVRAAVESAFLAALRA